MNLLFMKIFSLLKKKHEVICPHCGRKQTVDPRQGRRSRCRYCRLPLDTFPRTRRHDDDGTS